MAAALCFVSCVAGKGCCGKDGAPELGGGGGGCGVANGVAVAEAAVGLPISAMKRLLNGGRAASLLLPKGTAEQRAEVRVSVLASLEACKGRTVVNMNGVVRKA